MTRSAHHRDPDRIVVAYDDGAGSRTALRWAAERAQQRHLWIELVGVADIRGLMDDAAESLVRAQTTRALTVAEDWLDAHAPTVRHIPTTRTGDVAASLADAAVDAHCLVVGSKRGDPRHPIHFEGVPRKVAAWATVPTVIIPATWQHRSGPVTVGVGDDEISPAPLQFAAASAESARQPLKIVHAWWLLPRGASGSRDLYDPVDLDRARRGHQDITDDAARTVRTAHPALDVDPVAINERTGPAIIASARDSSLLVLGSRHSTVVAEWLLGSLVHDMLTVLPCPVAVVPTVPRRPPYVDGD